MGERSNGEKGRGEGKKEKRRGRERESSLPTIKLQKKNSLFSL